MKTKGSRNKKGVKRILNKWGYYEIFDPLHPLAKKNGYIREHRKIAFDVGLLTDPTNEVHHINGIKTDNRIENLQVLTKADHTKITWTGVKRSASGSSCKMCLTRTRSKYGLCRYHYKSEWAKGKIFQHKHTLK